MKIHVIIALLILSIANTYAQKPALQPSDFSKWTTTSKGQISNNGKYISYVIENEQSGEGTLTIKDSRGTLLSEFENASSSEFSDDSKFAVIQKNDTLILFSLEDRKVKSLPSITRFQLFNHTNKPWILCLNSKSDLECFPLSSADEKTKFKDVVDFKLSPSTRNLIIQSKDKEEKYKVNWVDFDTNHPKTIYSGDMASNFLFDNEEKQLAFFKESKVNGKPELFILCYNKQQDTTSEIITNYTSGIDSDMELSNRDNVYESWSFSKDGKTLFFCIKQREIPKSKRTGINVNIWSYQDKKLQSEQAYKNPAWLTYLCRYRFEDKTAIRLVDKDETIKSGLKVGWENQYIIVEKNEGQTNEWYWNESARQSTYIISVENGQRIPLQIDRKEYLNDLNLSPDNNYVVYYDSSNHDYYSYEISNRKSRNLTQGIATSWLGIFAPDYVSTPVGIYGWLEYSKSVIIGDRYDIWIIDPSGKRKAFNITNNSKMAISILNITPGTTNKFNLNNEVIVKTFDLISYHQKLHKLTFKKNIQLQKLIEGPYVYDFSKTFAYASSEGSVQKARDKNIYLVVRQSAETSLNYYLTENFKDFKEISNNHPERGYNWLTTELHHFPLNSTDTLNGVLFKPENFDPGKKYPVILRYYNTYETTILNLYPTPIPDGGNIDIPYMVSNGYLVFFLDIKYKRGKTGESALNAVLAVSNYLSSKAWIDSSKIGINGHSFGGLETNYIITRTNRFAAAISGAGLSDLVSGYGSLWGRRMGFSQQHFYEKGYIDMTGSLWESQKEYIENSAIFKANQITTPLLLMHNRNDDAVPFSQSMEFFTGLRRLKKPVWLLEYDGQEHTINDYNMSVDFSIRQKQFFDHYLKTEPMPKWMAKGIPAYMKGIDNGLEY